MAQKQPPETPPAQAGFPDAHDILMAAPIGIFTSTPEGRYITANSALARMYGYDSPEELIASITDIAAQVYADPADRESFQRFVEEYGEVVDHESRRLRRDGQIIWVSMNARAVRDQKGRVVAYLGFTMDISDRKRAEETLKLTEETYHNVFLNAQIGMFRTDYNTGLVIDANDAVARFAGCRNREEMLSEPFSIAERYVDPDDRRKMLALLKHKGEFTDFEAPFRKNDGSIIIMRFSARLVRVKGWIEGVSQDITKEKLTEKALRESEEKHRRLFETMTQGVIYQAADSSIISANPAAERILGLTFDQMRGKTSMAPRWRMIKEDGTAVPGSDHPAMIALRTGKTIGPVIRGVFHPDKNAHVWLNITAIPLFQTGEAKPFQAYATFEDVTDRKQTEDRLLESEERFRCLVEDAPFGLSLMRPDRTFEFINQQFTKIFGYTLEDIPNKDAWFNLAYPDQEYRKKVINTWTEDFGKSGVDGHILPRVFMVRCKNGRDKEIHFRSVLLKKGFQIQSYEDITERKKAEEALRESERKYRELFENAPVGIFQATPEGRYLALNPEYARIIGYASPEEMIEQVTDIATQIYVRPEERKRYKEHLRQHGSAKNFVTELKRLDGRSVWVSMNTKVQHGADGQVVYSGFLTDITESKSAEKEREKLQSQLLQALKMESLGTMAGGVAHDFNNLLQVISGNIQLVLRAKPADHEDTVRLNSVVKSIHRAAGLVKQLLLFGRKAESTKVFVDLNQEVEEAVRILERTIPKMIALELNLDQALWPLRADPVQIEQILLNLAANAVDAMPEGGRLIIETGNMELDEEFVRTHPGTVIGRHVCLAVSDTGCGMDETTLKNIFDPFFTTKEVGRGTGLGLPSVYGIVQTHDGHIECDSEPGLGTTIRIFLPVGDQEDVLTAEPQQEATIRGGSETILVVDDEPEIRELTREALEMLGYSVKMAVNGEHALDIYREHGKFIDLVLLDLNMPGMGGYKCLQELLRIEASVKVVIVSGYTANGQSREILESGTAGFIVKPYQLRELEAAVRGALDE